MTMTSYDRRLRLLVRVVIGAGAISLAGALAEIAHGVPAPRWWEVAVAALAFVLGETAVVRLRFGHDHYSLTWSETALVIGLVVLPSPWLRIVAPLAVALPHLVTRRPLVKVAFNAGYVAAGAWLARAVLLAIGDGDISAREPASWLALSAASFAFWTWNSSTVLAAVSYSQGASFLEMARRSVRISGLTWIGNNSGGVLLVAVASSNPWALALLPFVVVLLVMAYRGYQRAVQERDTWEVLETVSRELLHVDRDVVADVVLARLPGLLRAEFVELLVTDDADLSQSRCWRWYPTNETECRVGDPHTTAAAFWLRIVCEREPFVVTASRAPAAQREELERLGLAMVMVAPLLVNERCLGTLRVGFRGEFGLSDRDGRVFTTFANQVSSALHNARLFEDVQQERRQLSQVLQSSSAGIVSLDHSGRVRLWNPAMAAITGIEAAAALGKPLFGDTAAHHEDGTPFSAGTLVDLLIEESEAITVAVGPERDARWVQLAAAPVPATANVVDAIVLVARDVTELRRAQQALRDREADFRLLFAANPHPMFVCERDSTVIVEVNDAAVDAYGYSRRELLGADMSMLDLDPLEGLDAAQPLEHRHRRNDGVVIDVELTSHEIEFSGRSCVLLMAKDITRRKEVETQLVHQALHDHLTGLPNRTLLMDRLRHALDRTARDEAAKVAVLFFDLDRFKVINDSLGHEVGDQLLVAVADRIRRALRPGDTATRFGGDEFVIVCEQIRDEHEALTVAERLADSLAAPFNLGPHQVFVSASVGVAVSEPPHADAVALLRDADAAMYRAKGSGRNRCAIFDEVLRTSALSRLEMESDLRRAVDHGALCLQYQPTVSLGAHGRADEIIGVEALVRWPHPTRGLVPPSEFVPLAEETGLIGGLGRWVIDEACRQLAHWDEAGRFRSDFVVSVNLSPLQLADPTIVEQIADSLDRWGVRPSSLCMEITETAVLADVDATLATLHRLRALGVRVALDDFGTGYSALSYLRQLPVDVVKIDGSFVSRVAVDTRDRSIVAGMIDLAHALGLTVVAEGVETKAQLRALRELECDVIQGFVLFRPQEPAAIGQLMVSGAA